MAAEGVEDFMNSYWKAAASGVFANVAPFIGKDVTFFFSEGPFFGLAEIRKAFVKTWATIKEETYTIADLNWLTRSEEIAVCTYKFTSDGMIEGKHRSFRGVGTNVLQRISGKWKIMHEHLSTLPEIQG